jgi:DNA-binding PadR family transcriptional regulator
VINVDVYLKIVNLFRFRWDPAILAVLAEHPYRFRELANRLETQIDEHIDDNAVSRSLRRLTRAKHVQPTRTRIGRREVPVYAITDEGRLHLQTYGALIDTYKRLGPPGD